LSFLSDEPTQIWCNDNNALKIVENLVFHAKTKHIETHYHFVKEKVLKGEISLFHIPSKEQIAHILTKFWKNEVPRLQKYARG